MKGTQQFGGVGELGSLNKKSYILDQLQGSDDVLRLAFQENAAIDQSQDNKGVNKYLSGMHGYK